MARRSYDRFMLATKIGTNRKIRRLKPDQRWTHVAGVLALAAESPVPGHLLIAEGVAVGAEDVAEHASVSIAVAEKTLLSLRMLGVLKWDAEVQCEYVHDWDEWNQPSKSDPTAAARMRRYRERLRNEERNAGESYDRNVTRNGRNGDGDVRQEVEVRRTTGGTSDVSVVPHTPLSSSVVDIADVAPTTTPEAA